MINPRVQRAVEQAEADCPDLWVEVAEYADYTHVTVNLRVGFRADGSELWEVEAEDSVPHSRVIRYIRDNTKGLR